MGKQSRMKKERKAQREEMRPHVEEWSKIPEEAERGPCTSPTCTLPRCLDPWATVVDLHNKDYDGPIVMVCYSVYTTPEETERRLRVNGEEIAIIPKGKLAREDPEAHQVATQKLLAVMGERYGAGAALAVVQHLSRGAALYQQHSKRPQA